MTERGARMVAHGRSTLFGSLSALLTLLLVFLSSSGAAFAHAELLTSDPADGAVLAAAPSEIVLTFSEPVDPLVFRLGDSTGQVRMLPMAGAGSGPGSANTRLVVKLPAQLALGTHSLSWRVTSADGHPIGGALLFSVGKASAHPSGRASAIDPVTATGLWATRLLAMTGLVIGVGGAGWMALISSRRHVRQDTGSGAAARGLSGRDGRLSLVEISLWLGLAATPVWIVFQGFDALGEAAVGWVPVSVWKAGLFATMAVPHFWAQGR